MMNLNEIFGQKVTYDNLKSHKKLGFELLSGKYIFGKNIGGRRLI